MTTLHTELMRPCPFCGGPAHAMQEEYPEEWWVGCKKNACVSTDIHLDIDEAIETWNTRTPQPDAAAIRKAAYQQGWEVCAFWAGRPDLDADIDSPAYVKERDVALSTTLVEPAKNFCADCGQRNNGDLVHTCSPQILDAIRSEDQDAPLAINGITRFAGLVLKAHRNEGYPGDVDGGTLQEYATECGLIEAREVNEPCGEGCTCAEMALSNDYPFTCYFNTDAGKLALAAASPTQSKDA